MAFCQKCGQPIEETVNNCPYCGAPNAANPNPKKSNVSDIVSKAKTLNKKNVAIFAGAIAAVVLLIIIISSLASGGYKKALKNYVDVIWNGKANKIEKLAPEEYWEFYEERYDKDIDDVIDDYEDTFDDKMDYYEDEYGKNVKFKYTITDKDELDEDDLKDLKDRLKNDYDIPRKSVTKAFEVEYDYVIKGKEDEYEGEGEVIIAKIDGKWYVTNFF